jgi:hypothetical protein
MFKSLKRMTGMVIKATDGEIGSLDQFFFDDTSWAIRYFVVNIGSLVISKKVLISPASFQTIQGHDILVNSTIAQIKNSPDIDTEKPISRQKEEQLHDYFTWSYYWGYPLYYNSLGTELYPNIQYTDTFLGHDKIANNLGNSDIMDNNHLRSSKDIQGYIIMAKENEFGSVEDFLVDTENWAIRYIILNTGDLLPGKKVIVSAKWTKEIDWDTKTIHFDIDRDVIKNGPSFDYSIPLTRDFERRMFEYYEQHPYWET